MFFKPNPPLSCVLLIKQSEHALVNSRGSSSLSIMQTASVLHLFCAAALLISLVNAQSANRHPADDDPRIQKQPPFHWGTPPPNHRVKLDFIPIKVLASVRHERTSKHVPRDEALADASTAEEIILAKRLKESITTKKLGEVYSEQGYEDQNYDHGHFEKQGKFDEKFQNHDKAEHRAPQHNYDGAESSVFGQKEPHFNYDGAASSVSTDLSPLQTIIKPRSKKVVRGATDGAPTEAPVDSQKYPFYLTAPKNSPQRYATNPDLLPDKKNNPDMPFYASTNYQECPEMSPVLSVGPDDKNPKGEPRLRGLGDKIDCLVSKYFGADPFDNPFFKEEKVHAETVNPKYLLPSESNNGPVLFNTNASYKEKTENEAKTKKTRKRKNKKQQQHKDTPKYYPNHRQVAASTEQIEGMLPPPIPLRLRKARDLNSANIYSTVRGGVKFVTEPDEALLVQPTHRVSSNSKYGAREGNGRSYEVTEEPEDQIFKHLQGAKAFPARSVKVERHRLSQEEHGLYSSTYVPQPSVSSDQQEPITTSVWNAIPPRVGVPENVELGSSISAEILTTTTAPQTGPLNRATPSPGRSSRGRARASAPISEDIFQGRGERRQRPEGQTKQQVQRDRPRTNIRAPKRIETSAAIDTQYTVVSKYSADPSDAVPTEAIPTRPRKNQNRRPPPLAGDKPPVQSVGNSIAPRRNRPKANSAPPVPVIPEFKTDAPEKLLLPITELPSRHAELPPRGAELPGPPSRFTEQPPFIAEPPLYKPLPEIPVITEFPNADLLTLEPVARLPETTTNHLSAHVEEAPPTTTSATISSAPAGRQRPRGKARTRGGGAAEEAPRYRSRDTVTRAPAAADPAEAGEWSTQRVTRRGKPRTRAGSDNFDASGAAALNAPESSAARPRVPNQRSHATSPTAADHHQQEPSTSARY